MSTKSIAYVLQTLDKYLHAVNSPTAGGLVLLGEWLYSLEEPKLEAVLKKLSELKIPAHFDDKSVLVREVLPALDGDFVARLRRKEGDGDSKDIRRLADFLSQFKNLSVSTFVKACQSNLAERPAAERRETRSNALRQELVDTYFMKLHSTIGRDSEFNIVFHELDGDKRVRQLEMLAIANLLLTYPPKEKTGRKDLLKEILALHNAGASFDRHLRATAGRSAG